MTESRVQSYNFFVNSMYANEIQSSTNFKIRLVQPLFLLSKNGYWNIRVNDIQCPFSFFQLSKNINTLRIRTVDSLGNVSNGNIQIQPGNYDATTLLNELIKEINLFCFNTVNQFVPSLNIKYLESSNVYSFNCNSNENFTLYFSENLSLGKFFVCNNDIYFNKDITTKSQNQCLLNPVNALYLRCSLKQVNGNGEYIIERGVDSDIIYKIPINCLPRNWIVYNIQGSNISVLDDILLSIEFYLTDNLSYEPVDLNGLSISFSFDIFELERIPYIEKSNLVYTDLPRRSASNGADATPTAPITYQNSGSAVTQRRNAGDATTTTATSAVTNGANNSDEQQQRLAPLPTERRTQKRETTDILSKLQGIKSELLKEHQNNV